MFHPIIESYNFIYSSNYLQIENHLLLDYSRRYKILKIFVFFLLTTYAYGQNLDVLEQKRMQVIEQIEITDKLLENRENERQKEIETLAALRAQIAQRNQLLENIKSTISATEIEIEKNQLKLDSLEKRLVDIEHQYKKVLRSKYIRKRLGSQWITILSAHNINQAFLRWNYYRQFETYRKSKIDEIKSVKRQIDNRNKEMIDYALKNSELIQDQERQNTQLQVRVEQQNNLLSTFEEDKSLLQKQLEEIKIRREGLNQAIEQGVLGELTNGNNSSILTADILQYDISTQKGLLSIPVTNGYINDESGNTNNIDRNSVSIILASNAKVIAIAAGKVISVRSIKGYGKMIILQHGEYYSIYTNLNYVNVKEGETITVNTPLGTVANGSALSFELWKNKERLSPLEWLQN